ncbi:MAG: hypothetical protein FWF57_08650 [Defluviitaleaceae bacterium]|nr:hypothetical protein [Defluviitaleaceae bacterium]
MNICPLLKNNIKRPIPLKKVPKTSTFRLPKVSAKSPAGISVIKETR